MKKTGIVKDERFMMHEMGLMHPESPKRLEAIYEEIAKSGIEKDLVLISPREATKDELLYIHREHYISKIESTQGKAYTYLDPDTQTNAYSYEAALLAAGGLCEAIKGVIDGDMDNAFALVRPPGHHAEADRAMGFCIFNNVAIGARYAQRVFDIKRVLIVDWDLHHGNATQHSFEDDPSVLYFSTHQYPYYPGTGRFNEIGLKEGMHYTVNLPLSPGYGDCEYVYLYENVLRPIAEDFSPQLVLVSAGFDIYMGDPLGGMRVSPDGFSAICRVIMNIAERCCNGRLVITLEGGYNLEGLRNSVREVLKELMEQKISPVEEFISRADRSMTDPVCEMVKRIHGGFWRSIK